jgi:hypothetical protein
MDKLEGEYLTLRKLGQKLHIPIPEAFWELEVIDGKGNVLQRHRQRSHSWVRNVYNLMFTQLAGKDADDNTFGAGKLSTIKTDGSVQYGAGPMAINPYVSDSVDDVGFGYRALANDDEAGILVGGGTSAESFEDYALQTKIDTGNGAGQLAYAESEPHSVSYDAGAKVLRNELVRYFNNNSGGSISINETALVYASRPPGGGTGYQYYLASRDKLASTVTVPNTGQLKVTYIVQLTYPA